MKRLCMFLLIGAFAFSAVAQVHYCYECATFGPDATLGDPTTTPDGQHFYDTEVDALCLDMGLDTVHGHVVCASAYTDCHDGTAGPCAPHCHVSVQACDGSNNGCGLRGLNTDPRCQEGTHIADGGRVGCQYLPEGCDDRYSPLVIKLSHGAYRFSGVDDPVWFDINADGKLEHITWTARGSEVGFIVVDRNGNGRIDSGKELFGDLGTALNGFEWLRYSDSNGDGIIDANDAIWPRLRIWIDANHDGVTQAGELQTMDQADMQTLGLTYNDTHRADPNGNELRFRSWAVVHHHIEPYYDVYFKAVH